MRIIIAAACVAVAGHHAVPAAKADDIEEISVTSSPLGDILQPSRVLDEQELLLKREATIGETLAREPGVTSSYFGPASSRPVIRGLGGSRIKVLNDAIGTLDASDVSADHAVTIEPVLANGIEIIRGPATLLYGSQAAGGVVNVLDRKIPQRLPEDGFDGAVEIRGDTATGEETLVAGFDAGLGPIVVHLEGLTRETDDVEIPGFATADPAERSDEAVSGTLENSASETDSYAGGVSWVGEGAFIGISASHLENRYGLPGPGEGHEHGHGAGEPELFPGPFIDMEQTRVDLRGETALEGVMESASIAIGINDYEHAEIEPSGEIGTLFDNEAWQARLELVHRPVGGLRGAIGLQIDDRDFSALGEEAFVEPVQTESWGLFAVEQLELGWGRMDFGLRAELLDHEPSDSPAYDDTAVSAALGTLVPIGENLELLANLSRTERHPAAEELYSGGPHLAAGQFEIGLLAAGGVGAADKETSLNLDVGLRRTAGPLRFAVSVFYNDIEDYIYQDLTGDVEDDLPVAVYRQEDAEFWGMEAELRVLLGDSLPLNPELRLFGDFVEAELDDGSDLPRIPPLRIGGGASIGQDAWRFNLDLVWHDDQQDITSFRTDSYTMLNVGGWYRLELGGASVELFARGTNLLDEEARRSTSFLAGFAPLPGVSVTGGARLLF